MGLATLEEVYNHMAMHYDAYFTIGTLGKDMYALEVMLDGLWSESIYNFLTPDDIKRLDDDLDAATKGEGLESQVGEADSSADEAGGFELGSY
jgi:hypothetical protein